MSTPKEVVITQVTNTDENVAQQDPQSLLRVEHARRASVPIAIDPSILMPTTVTMLQSPTTVARSPSPNLMAAATSTGSYVAPQLPVSHSYMLDLINKSPGTAISSIVVLFILIILSIVVPTLFSPCNCECPSCPNPSQNNNTNT